MVVCKHYGVGCAAHSCFNAQPRKSLRTESIYCGAMTKTASPIKIKD